MNTPTTTTETAGLGHNQPSAHAALLDRVDQLVEIGNEWFNQVSEIENEDQAQKASDFNERVRAELKDVEKARKTEKQPHIDAGKAVDQLYRPLTAKLETIKSLFGPKLTAWLQKKEAERREAERKAEEEAYRKMKEAEEAERKAQEAAQAEGPADVIGTTMEAEEAKKAAEEAVADAHRLTNSTVGVKGNYGDRKTALRTTYSAEITEYAVALEHCMNDPKVKEIVQQLANAWARSPEQRKQPFPGVNLIETKTAA